MKFNPESCLFFSSIKMIITMFEYRVTRTSRIEEVSKLFDRCKATYVVACEYFEVFSDTHLKIYLFQEEFLSNLIKAFV